MFVTYPDVLQPGRDDLRAGWPLALLAASDTAVSHAIPSEQLACSYHFVSLSHSCLGIACDFGVGRECGCGGRGRRGYVWGAGGEGVWVGREGASGVCLGCGLGCVEGVSVGALGECLGCGWGAPGSGWGAAVAVAVGVSGVQIWCG